MITLTIWLTLNLVKHHGYIIVKWGYFGINIARRSYEFLAIDLQNVVGIVPQDMNKDIAKEWHVLYEMYQKLGTTTY